MTYCFDGAEPTHAASATPHLLDERQLQCYRSFADEPAPRPLPDPDRLSGAVVDIFDTLFASLGETRLEPDLVAGGRKRKQAGICVSDAGLNPQRADFRWCARCEQACDVGVGDGIADFKRIRTY